MTRDEVLQCLAPWREAHMRMAWKPVVRDGDGMLAGHKFSGRPWLAEGEAWPRCAGCASTLQLFLQLNLVQLPAELSGQYGEGLLQLFYCVADDCDAALEAWGPFSQGQLVRVVDPKRGQPSEVEEPEGHFPAKTIVDWELDADYPSTAEHELLGLTYDYDFAAKKVRVTWRDAGMVMDDVEMEIAEAISVALPGDKLGGWPNWVQGVEYPGCPRCGERMELVFQLDSEVNLPYMFGDCGCGHITQCPVHKDVVAFGWACC